MPEQNAQPQEAQVTPQQALAAEYDNSPVSTTVTQTPEPVAPVVTPPAAAPTQPAAPVHNQLWVREALALGAHPDDIEASDPADLKAWVQHQTQAKVPPPEPAKPTGPNWGKRPDGTPATRDDYEPHMQELIESSWEAKQLKATFEKQTADLKAELAQERQARTTAEANNQYERLFAKNPEMFGQGTRLDLDPRGAEMQKRNAFAGLMNNMQGRTLAEKYAAAMQAIQMFAPAAATPAAPQVYGQQTPGVPNVPPAPARPRDAYGRYIQSTPAEQQAIWAAQGLPHPSQRNGAPEPDGREKAIKAVAEAQRIAREQAVASSSDLDGFLPG